MTETVINAQISAREDQANGIAVFEISPMEGEQLPAFSAGAHIDVILNSGLVRQYSLSNAPGQPVYRLGILNDPESRGGSKEIHATLEPGMAIQISAPRNHFPLQMEAEHSILFGGGIGITPMISMAYALRDSGRSFELHYSYRDESRAGFITELKQEFGPYLHLHPGDGAPVVPADVCRAAPTGSHLYVCGPSGYMDWVIDEARQAGCPESQIHFEYFNADIDVSGEAFDVVAAASGVEVHVAAGESIAHALNAAGIKVQVSCEQGVCGTCICDVIEGTPDHRDLFLTDEEKEDNDQIAVCCSRAKTSRLVLDI